MKLQGLSDKAIGRIAKTLKSQDSNPDYGEGSPEEVKEILEEAGAKWTSEGWVVPGDLDFSELGLTRLPLIKEVGRSFYCDYNQLISLEGCPKNIGGNFHCGYNQLTSLEGSPKEVDGYFDCSHNELTSLEGCPKEVDGHFYCENNPLISLNGIGEVGGEIFSDLD